MAETEPTSLPEWASSNPTDPVSGQPAILEPLTAKKQSGFLHKERPPRQDFNWLFNLSWLWIKWFKQQINALWNNVYEFITNSGILEDMILDSDNFDSALRTRFSDWKIEGFEITDWSQVVLTGTTEAHITYNEGRCRSDDGKFCFDSNVLFSMTGFVKKFRWDGGFTKGTNQFGVADPAGLVAGTWYYIFLVYFDDQTFDIAMDSDVYGFNVYSLTGAVYVRRLSAHYFNSVVAGFYDAVKQTGDLFERILPGINQTITKGAGVFSTDYNCATNNWVPPGIDVSLIADIILTTAPGVNYTAIYEKWRDLSALLPSPVFHHFSANTEFNTRRKFFLPSSNPIITAWSGDSVAAYNHEMNIQAIEDKRTPWSS